ncbi:hypothetical protein P171DRAFT_479099 [Karstenula rhodostoma CBS 690.94]|uniref:Uncharacterized protein n=1 Tax=Karstenula rhodostoma CBS 690.94 TaxID=1392251 RepID=A0A9P4UHE0_9PLEO|nr:hypothetical protein P171DRAFT_479099 [Karstenula rhodostoma CBS 690.94]
MLHRNPPHPAPNVRGEDETELQHLINIIEGKSSPFSTNNSNTPTALSWQVSPVPNKHFTVLLGRHPKPPTPSSAYIAAVYSMSKGGAKALEIGPEMGVSRKEALRRLLEVVEGEVGRGVLRDGRKKGEAVVGMAERPMVGGSGAAGIRGEGVGELRGRGDGGGAGARMRGREDMEQRDGGARREGGGER